MKLIDADQLERLRIPNVSEYAKGWNKVLEIIAKDVPEVRLPEVDFYDVDDGK